MNNMADEDNNNNNNSDSNNKKVNSNVNCNNSPNCSKSRANASCDAKKIAKNLSNKPSGSAAAGETSKSERCVLCLDEKRSPVRITCGHSFCNECLEVYLSYQKYAWANRCPICRGSLKEQRRSVKRKHSETDHPTDAATMSGNAGASSSQYRPTRRRLHATSATVAAATAAVATATATALSESTVEASAEQIYLLEEFMAIAAETDVFGIANSMGFGNPASATTPTNSASTVSASEAAGEDDDIDLQAAEFEEEVEQGISYSQDDFASDIGDEEGLEEEDNDEEVFGEDIDVEEDEEFEDEEDDGDDDGDDDVNDDESNDLHFFDEYDDENHDDHENYDFDTLDEGDADSIAGSDAYDQLADNNLPTAEYYDVDQNGEDDVLLVDEVIIVD
ncbi:acidic repeat-containing protein [Bactrocera tryoni]|uniref:acidic repeat-containing protein n=1 Tax=Bactrocera tryoni TaxID=59916 RepID=UPI001A972FDB|nr:acidic repeat-containing protein [Bactrocera tryoni]